MSTMIRPATPADKDFIITAIVEAEKSGSDLISYCAIFSITEAGLRKILGDILDEDIKGQELCLSNFLIAEVDGEKAAAISTWIEKENGMASNMIKSNVLMFFIDREILLNATPLFSLMNEISIARQENALQIECVYSSEGFRGRGLTWQLIDEAVKLKTKSGPKFNKVQVILLKNNEKALNAYRKAGFTVVQEKQCADKAILQILPGDTKILMERNIDNT